MLLFFGASAFYGCPAAAGFFTLADEPAAAHTFALLAMITGGFSLLYGFFWLLYGRMERKTGSERIVPALYYFIMSRSDLVLLRRIRGRTGRLCRRAAPLVCPQVDDLLPLRLAEEEEEPVQAESKFGRRDQHGAPAG